MNFKQDKDTTKNIVYKYTNIINNKVYIGRTMKSIAVRAGTNGQGYKSCTKFWHAICKYGWNNFKLEILAKDLSYKQSIELESKYIKEYRSNEQEYGYNILSEEPYRGYSMPLETRLKLSEARKHLTKEQRERISASHVGQKAWNKGLKTGPLSEEQKKRFSDIRKGNKNSIHVPIQDITTGETFRSGAEAGRSINRTSEAIFWSIKHNKPCNGHYFKRIYEEMPNDYRNPV